MRKPLYWLGNDKLAANYLSGALVAAKRWIVDRTFGWLGRCRRLAKGFENLARTQAAFFILAMIRLMLRRITRLRTAS